MAKIPRRELQGRGVVVKGWDETEKIRVEGKIETCACSVFPPSQGLPKPFECGVRSAEWERWVGHALEKDLPARLVTLLRLALLPLHSRAPGCQVRAERALDAPLSGPVKGPVKVG